MPIGKTWQAPSGATLREVMIKWAGETRCESGASPTWTVIWPMSVTDYRLDAPLTFQGAYESMLGQVFELYRTAKTPLYGQASRLQCVVSVSDTPPVSQ
ncbi:TcpQ domain-containing protein [Pectobacterium carotovorum]|uniref:TcpQ domain-containing protein n=1 Tax=Pectobacterium carotovorum TaxID=554 RepID=UPI0032EF7D53